MSRPAGAEWVQAEVKRRGIELSPLGRTVADILGIVYRGVYNAPITVRNVDWANPRWIEVVVYGSLDTYDGNLLTKLVLAAHKACVRVEVNPRAFRYLALYFSPREREGGVSQRHPTIEQAVADFDHVFGWLEAVGPPKQGVT